MYSGFYRTHIGFYILIACVLVALLVAWVLVFWDAEVIFAWVYWRMVETAETLGEFWKELGKLL